MYQNDPQKCLTGKVRLSYCSLLAPRVAQQGDAAKYSVTLLIPKADVATKADLDAAIQAAAADGIAKTWGGVRPPVVAAPLHDGDGVRLSGEPFGDECKGHWVMAASSKQKPQVVDLSLSEILNQSDIYSGMYARVTVRFFAYNRNGKKGVGCGLGNVMKVADGEPLSGRAGAESDFAGVAVPAPAPAYPPQNAPQYTAPAPPVPAINPVTGQPMYTAAPQQVPAYPPQYATPQQPYAVDDGVSI